MQMSFPTARILLGLFLSIGVTKVFYAQNLVANPDFEDQNVCTEYFARCAPEGWREVNYRRTYYIHNNKGGKAGVQISNDRNIRSFLFTELLCPLVAGEQYTIDFDLNLRGNPFVPLGMFFSDQDFTSHFSADMADSVVVFSQASSLKKIKKMDWMPFRATFRARGGERYLYIGYFEKSRGNYDGIHIVYLDNIQVKSEMEAVPMCTSAESKRAELYADDRRHVGVPEEDTTTVAPQPETQLPEEEEPEVAGTPLKIDTLLLSGVCFDFDKSTLNAHYAAVTDSLIERIMARNPESVHISGHTDNIGTEDFNLKLSLARAQTIGNLFVQKGLSPEKISCDGRGETQPAATNDTETGRAANRRIELVLLFKNQ